MTDVVADNLVVLFKYVLTDSEGIEIDASGDDAMPYLHGGENIVPGLEREMTGKKVGDKFDVVVAPSDGYGEYQEGGAQQVPRDAFPEGVEIEVGMPFMLEAPDGSLITIWITDVDDETIEFDANHPLAGEELHFSIEITRIREATEDELSHGHPHGPEGTEEHHHH